MHVSDKELNINISILSSLELQLTKYYSEQKMYQKYRIVLAFCVVLLYQKGVVNSAITNNPPNAITGK